MRTASTRVIDIKPVNRIKKIEKLENGDLRIEQKSGDTFTVKKSDPLFQEFAVYSVIAEL